MDWNKIIKSKLSATCPGGNERYMLIFNYSSYHIYVSNNLGDICNMLALYYLDNAEQMLNDYKYLQEDGWSEEYFDTLETKYDSILNKYRHGGLLLSDIKDCCIPNSNAREISSFTVLDMEDSSVILSGLFE